MYPRCVHLDRYSRRCRRDAVTTRDVTVVATAGADEHVELADVVRIALCGAHDLRPWDPAAVRP